MRPGKRQPEDRLKRLSKLNLVVGELDRGGRHVHACCKEACNDYRALKS